LLCYILLLFSSLETASTAAKSVPISLTSHNMGIRVALGTPTATIPKITAKTPTSTVTATLPAATKREISFENLKSTTTTNQRYSSDDLYKPRPFVSKGRTRRNRGLDETTALGIVPTVALTTTTPVPSSTTTTTTTTPLANS